MTGSPGKAGSTGNLRRRISRLESILEVAKTLATHHELDGLLAQVVEAVRSIAEAERGTIFLLDAERGELWSKVAQGRGQIRFPADRGIAGEVVRSKACVNVPDAYADPRFNPDFDRTSGFRTREILAVPMLSTLGEVVGVIEAINHRPGPDGRPRPFGPEEEEFLLALAGQAAGAIENALLYDEIHELFEGFIKASVVAIESRDPTTSGHSERVAKLTCGLAELVDRRDAGEYAAVRFSRDQMKQLRYAALLHDFGKVGVREHVLVKAEKLYPAELAGLLGRFDFIRRTIEKEGFEARHAALEGRDRAAAERAETLTASRLAELADIRRFLLECNVPTVLARGGFDRLREIGERRYESFEGPKPFITERELASLSIARGSLTEDDRVEIESHVIHTYRFLSAIPWTKDLRRVPEIAYGHHEKLDGAGYPLHLPAAAIPVETRMMTISDIFDALTASDRPYKRAVPLPKALDILRAEAKEGKIDAPLLDLFVDGRVYEAALKG